MVSKSKHYNRWGQIVFKSSDPEFKWDGIHQETLVGVPKWYLLLSMLDKYIRLYWIRRKFKWAFSTY